MVKSSLLVLPLLLGVLAACVTGGGKREGAGGAGADWGDVTYTDPREFRPKNRQNPPFLFLVVGIFDPRLRETQHETSSIEAAQNSKAVNPEKAIDLLETPERVADKAIISASLIDERRLQTWGYSGFILSASDDNVFAASTKDLGLGEAMLPGTPMAQALAKARAVQKKLGRLSPAALLKATDLRRLNEVGLYGRAPSGDEVKIVGAFIKTDVVTGQDLCSDEQRGKIEALARKRNLPVIRIYQAKPPSKKKKGKDATEFSF